MDEQTKKEITEYLVKLPKEVQQLVTDKTWVERIKEVSAKYSLNETQTQDLENEVLYILVGLNQPEDFSQTLMETLGVSRLLAAQITEELNTRVFEYALKMTGTKSDETIVPATAPTAVPVPQITPIHHTVMAPDNLPGEVVEEVTEKALPIGTPNYTVDPYREAI